MPIPNFQSFMLPTLQILSDQQEHANRELNDAIAKKFALTTEDRSQRMANGQSAFSNRSAWARGYFKKADLIENPSPESSRITPLGLKVFQENKTSITIETLKSLPAFQFNKSSSIEQSEISHSKDFDKTPSELLETAYQAIQEDLADRLLEQLKACTPTRFEKLVLELLKAMGYGDHDAARVVHSGKSGDEGIDGMVWVDKLGLEAICVQAKRYVENSVGRPEVQAFAGSMEAFRAKKGVLFTTSRFSHEAQEYVDRGERKIILIDGKRLAQLMMENNVGVSKTNTFILKAIDLDAFADED